jgi:hypothetical protein
MMDTLQKPSNSECFTPSLEPFRTYQSPTFESYPYYSNLHGQFLANNGLLLFISLQYTIINHSLLKTTFSVTEDDGIKTILIIQ